MADYIDIDEVIALIEERQKQLCPTGMYGRHYVYGSDREKYDAWQDILDSINSLQYIEVDDKNEPLTLDELREMDGEPVWSERYNMWMLIDIGSKNGPCVVDSHGGWLTLEQDKYYRKKLEANDED